MYRRPAYYDRGSQPRFSTLQFSPRLASSRLASFLPSSFLFPVPPIEPNYRLAYPFIRFVFFPVFHVSWREGRYIRVYKEGRGRKERRHKARDRELLGRKSSRTLSLFIVARMCICLLSILEAIISFLNCETAVSRT